MIDAARRLDMLAHEDDDDVRNQEMAADDVI